LWRGEGFAAHDQDADAVLGVHARRDAERLARRHPYLAQLIPLSGASAATESVALIAFVRADITNAGQTTVDGPERPKLHLRRGQPGDKAAKALGVHGEQSVEAWELG